MLTDREQFKVAFLAKCASQGLSAEEAGELASAMADSIQSSKLVRQQPATQQQDREKQAVGGIGSAIGGTMSAAGKLIPWMFRSGVVIPAIAAGSAGGYMLGKTRGITDEDVDEEKQKELIDAYQSAASRARQRTALADRKKQQPRPSRSLI